MDGALDSSTLYFAADGTHYPGGPGSFLWLLGDRLITLTRDESAALFCCKRPDSYAGHLHTIRSRLRHLSEQTAAAMLSKLIDAGTLVGFNPADRLARSAEENTPALSCLAIVTANRPACLKRCLESFLVHASDCSTSLANAIVCDASLPDLDAATKEMCSRIEKTYKVCISHVSAAAKWKLHLVMGKQGIPTDVLSFGLPAESREDTPGANRNWLLVLGAGQRFLSADDDTVAATWQPGENEPDLRLVGHTDGADYAFYDTRAEALQDLSPAQDGLFQAHGRFLHKNIEQVIASAARVDAKEACAHLLSRRGPHARVVLSYGGIAGDSGMLTGVRFLLATGTVREQLASDSDAYQRALHSRELRYIHRGVTLAHDQICMMTVAGIDNESFLPPFLPVGRNEDGVFGTLLKLILPDSAFVNLPVGVLHQSHRAPEYLHTPAAAAGQPRVSDLFIRLLRGCPLSSDLDDPRARLTAIAEYLGEIARYSAKAFSDILQRRSREHCAGMIAHVDELIAGFAYPAAWVSDLQAYRSALLASMASGSCAAASDLPPGAPLAEAGHSLQQIVANFAKLLMWWPRLRELGHHLQFTA